MLVTKEELAEFIKHVFPTCPICGEDSSYEISGFAKNYFQCNSCGAKWMSQDLIKNKIEDINFKKAELWEPARDGRGKGVNKKDKSVNFWQNLSSELLKEIDSEQINEDVKLIFDSNMTVSQLEKSIMESMKEITTWDYGATRYGKLGFILDKSSYAEQATVRYLRAIFEQNKILIIQNELLRRLLNEKEASKKTEET